MHSTEAARILATVQPGAAPPFQAERDQLARSAVKELWALHELRAVHAQLSRLVAQTDTI